MAARLEPTPRAPSPQLVDLRHLRSEDLDALLDEEVATWRHLLDWDFGKSAELVRRFVDMRALNGCALVDDGEAAGYAYYVLEEHKGLIGDVFVREAYCSGENEHRLLESVLGSLDRAAWGRPHRIAADDVAFGGQAAHAPLSQQLRTELHDARNGPGQRSTPRGGRRAPRSRQPTRLHRTDGRTSTRSRRPS